MKNKIYESMRGIGCGGRADYICLGLLLFSAFIGMGLLGLKRNQRQYFAIDTSVRPQTRDVNHDGIQDVVLQRRSGEELILYGTPQRNYAFGEGERKN